ncbi:MAG: maltokinase N-terminal cap-like domain-containing protein [Solirubrobacteraceae bacterium]
MSEPVQSPTRQLIDGLDLEALAEWLEQRRWYSSKSRHVTAAEIEDAITIAERPPIVIVLLQARFASGSHELYQLPLAFEQPADERSDGADATASERADGAIAIPAGAGLGAIDVVADPEYARELLRHINAQSELETEDGTLRFHRIPQAGWLKADGSVRPVGVEQSNSSIVFGDETVLKVFRKLEPGINPELELLQFLTAHDFHSIAPLQGWYEYEGRAFTATLGVAQRFFGEARGGWELALEQMTGDPELLLGELGGLGKVTAELHNTLASDPSDPAFAPEEPSSESLSLLTATIDEDIERIFVRLPDDERVAPIAGRGQDVREEIAARTKIGSGGRAIRTHGDFHLGQTLHIPGGWLIIDFEGEPARPLFERRQKRSPLRDVASMLRSFAYVTSASEHMHGQPAPADFEQRARRTFLEHYFSNIDPTLLPAGESAILNLLSIFELEKAIYELQYELDNRPDWLAIPVAGIARLLEAE